MKSDRIERWRSLSPPSPLSPPPHRLTLFCSASARQRTDDEAVSLFETAEDGVEENRGASSAPTVTPRSTLQSVPTSRDSPATRTPRCSLVPRRLLPRTPSRVPRACADVSLLFSTQLNPPHYRYDSANLLEVLFTCRGSVFPKVFFRSALCAGLGGLSYWLVLQGILTDVNVDLHTYVGVILGLLLVFRTNISCKSTSACYEVVVLCAGGGGGDGMRGGAGEGGGEAEQSSSSGLRLDTTPLIPFLPKIPDGSLG